MARIIFLGTAGSLSVAKYGSIGYDLTVGQDLSVSGNINGDG